MDNSKMARSRGLFTQQFLTTQIYELNCVQVNSIKDNDIILTAALINPFLHFVHISVNAVGGKYNYGVTVVGYIIACQ